MGSSDPTAVQRKHWHGGRVSYHRMYWPAIAALSLALSVSAEEDQILQDDPCLVKSKVVCDVQYCDRYWECTTGDPELYDCPNGLVWVGKNQGIADGCDYPWRHSSICKDKNLANPPEHGALRLAVRYLRSRDVLHPLLDLLERHRHRAVLHRGTALQRGDSLLRLATERGGMSETPSLQGRR